MNFLRAQLNRVQTSARRQVTARRLAGGAAGPQQRVANGLYVHKCVTDTRYSMTGGRRLSCAVCATRVRVWSSLDSMVHRQAGRRYVPGNDPDPSEVLSGYVVSRMELPHWCAWSLRPGAQGRWTLDVNPEIGPPGWEDAWKVVSLRRLACESKRPRWCCTWIRRGVFLLTDAWKPELWRAEEGQTLTFSTDTATRACDAPDIGIRIQVHGPLGGTAIAWKRRRCRSY
ncbi:hypothetical protein C8Q77DRAFT_1121003 [Trametes polyzona]|nr:hypothetical protein C8Q77DRAFT_1121003 [Trametes polyzona]